MRVLVVAPSWASTPPVGHGPGEQHAADLAGALRHRGHDVTVFATGDSDPGCALAWHFPRAGTEPHGDRERQHVDAALRYAESTGFDVIHSNESNIGLLRIGACLVPSVTRINWAGTAILRARFQALPVRQRQRTVVCPVSHSLSRRLRYLRPVRAIHNGVNVGAYTASGDHSGPLLFLGRICPEKGPDTAIKIAQVARREIVLAGPITNQQFFEARIRPRLRDGQVSYVGHATAEQKRELFAAAAALLMPYRSPEPFGYVLLEAMASGTPCVAFDQGAPAEIIDHGRTGFLVRSIRDAVHALSSVSAISSEVCRRHVQSRFSVDAMADAYLELYRAVLSR